MRQYSNLLVLGGVIRPGQPVAVVIREEWERALGRASSDGDMDRLRALARMYEGFEREAEKAGRN